jgi:hypothetical protein
MRRVMVRYKVKPDQEVRNDGSFRFRTSEVPVETR